MEDSTKVRNKGYSTPIKQEVDIMSTVRVQSLIDATVKLTGTVSGKQYVFHGAGSIVDVDIRDKDELLNKKRGNGCCGGQSGKHLFQLV
jgi:hypothetical protein